MLAPDRDIAPGPGRVAAGVGVVNTGAPRTPTGSARADPTMAGAAAERRLDMTDHSTSVVHAFTSTWEHQCCGEALWVGDEVTLQHVPFEPDDVWTPLRPIDW